MNQEVKIILAGTFITVLILIVSVFFFSKKDQSTHSASSLQSNSGQAGQASIDTKVLYRNANHKITATEEKAVLVEFADFQCPACAAFHPAVDKILKDYEGKITFIYRHFPLAQHANAKIAAKAAEAAGEGGRFWEMSDMLYEKQSEWNQSDDATSIFLGYAKTLGLKTEQFAQDLKDSKFDITIQTDYGDGVSLGVNSTPTFFLNGEKVFLNSYSDLSKVIEKSMQSSK